MATVYVIGPNISVTPSSTTLTWAQAQSQALSVAMVATPGPGNPAPTGTVMLTTGSWNSAATALSGGSATITIPPGTVATGVNTLNLSYSGDSNYAPENPAGSAVVTVGAVTVSVLPSSSTINSSQALPVTITVSAGSGSPTPTGMVWLASGFYASGATPLTGGSATLTIPGGILAYGVDILEASYGQGNYAAASGQASVTVTAPPGFTITGTPVTVTAGATTGNTSTITVTPTGGFTGSVVLTADVTPNWSGVAYYVPTVSFGGTSPVNISGTGAGIATLTVTTTAAVGCSQAQQTHREIPWYTGGGAILAFAMLFGIPARRRRWRAALSMAALLIIVAGGLLACGGGSDSNCNGTTSGTTPGSYIITVYGTSGATGTLGQVMLTVH
jgi:hypothetical protein